MFLGVVAALARLHECDRAVAPRPQQRADAGRPGPLARAVEELAVADVVAELELLVREQVAVCVEDALRQSRGARGVVELGGIVGRGVGELVFGRGIVHRRLEVVPHHEHPLGQPLGDAVSVRNVGDHEPRARVAQAVLDALVPVEHRHREQDRAALVGAEEDRRRLGERRQERGHAVAALHPHRLQHVRKPVRELLELAEAHAPLVPLPVLPDHRQPVGVVLVAHVAGDVVALRHLPAVRGAHLVVAPDLVFAQAHRLEGLHAFDYGRKSDQTHAQTPSR